MFFVNIFFKIKKRIRAIFLVSVAKEIEMILKFILDQIKEFLAVMTQIFIDSTVFPWFVDSITCRSCFNYFMNSLLNYSTLHIF